jgi:predicted hydrolase (HD superfamily)
MNTGNTSGDSGRVNPFSNLSDDFAPKVAVKPDQKVEANVKAVVEAVALDNNFPSRKAQPPKKVETVASPRVQRRYVTGRNQQVNIKATAATVDRFYRLADKFGLTLGEMFEKAVQALEDAG